MNRLAEHILSAMAARGGWVSSAGMVAALGVSRMTVSKQVRRLRVLGYGIEASPRRGYRLAGRTDRPVAEEVQPMLKTQLIGRTYRYFDTLDSTNSFLRSRIEEFPDGTAVIADAQSRGRGRLRRHWVSPPGVNLYLSVLLKPVAPPLLAPQLSLVAAAAVLRALHAEGCGEARVKWPNDILWRGRKMAGILCEMEAEADLIHGVIIGIGVNVNTRAFPPALRRTATSVRAALGRPVSRPALAAGILNRLDEGYAEWIRGGFSAVACFLNEHSFLSGREVIVSLTREKLRGRVERITEAGLLRVILASGEAQEITSGEVRLCRPRVCGEEK